MIWDLHPNEALRRLVENSDWEASADEDSWSRWST